MSEKNSVKRDLAIVSDLYMKATEQFPGYDRGEALNLYTAKKIDDSEKLIVAQRRENSKLGELVDTLSDELKSIEQNEAAIQAELERLKQLARPEDREQLLNKIKQNAAELEADRESIKKALNDHASEKNEIAKFRQVLDQREKDMNELKIQDEKTVKAVTDMSNILKGINLQVNKALQDVDNLKHKTFDLEKEITVVQTQRNLDQGLPILEDRARTKIATDSIRNYVRITNPNDTRINDSINEISDILHDMSLKYNETLASSYEQKKEIFSHLIEPVTTLLDAIQLASEEMTKEQKKVYFYDFNRFLTLVFSAVLLAKKNIKNEDEQERFAEDFLPLSQRFQALIYNNNYA